MRHWTWEDGGYGPDIDIKQLAKMMEEMAAAPKEEMGKRQPGEKGSYERN